jgi:hypothetical protein
VFSWPIDGMYASVRRLSSGVWKSRPPVTSCFRSTGPAGTIGLAVRSSLRVGAA